MVGQHVTVLALASPGLAALACLASVYLLVWLVYFGLASRMALLLAGAGLNWCVFFSLLFITAGPAPLLDRGEITPAVRYAEISGALFLLAWVVVKVRASISLQSIGWAL
jgi:hypothetical protein